MEFIRVALRYTASSDQYHHDEISQVTLLFAVTWQKREEEYLTIFGKMKEDLQAVPSEAPNG